MIDKTRAYCVFPGLSEDLNKCLAAYVLWEKKDAKGVS